MINCDAAFKWNIFNVQFLLQKSCTSILFWQWSRTLGKGSDRGFLRSAKSRVIFFECMDKAIHFPVPHLQLKIPETHSYRNSLHFRHTQNFGNRNNVRGIPCLIWSVFRGDLRQNHGDLHGLIEANSNEYHRLEWEKDRPCY